MNLTLAEFATGALFVGTWLVGLALDAVLVGIAAAVVMLRRRRFTDTQQFFIVLFCVVVYETLTLPAIMALDATIIIGNETVRQLLGAERTFPLSDLYAVTPFGDVAVWLVQAWVALRIGKWATAGQA